MCRVNIDRLFDITHNDTVFSLWFGTTRKPPVPARLHVELQSPAREAPFLHSRVMAEKHLRQYEVVLFGATGYTGKLCAEYIHAKLPRDLRWAVAGRSRGKLEAFLATLSSIDGSRTLPGVFLAC